MTNRAQSTEALADGSRVDDWRMRGFDAALGFERAGDPEDATQLVHTLRLPQPSRPRCITTCCWREHCTPVFTADLTQLIFTPCWQAGVAYNYLWATR
jgi:hypothetical protein